MQISPNTVTHARTLANIYKYFPPIILKPNDFLPSGAIFTAKGEAIDQKIA